MACNIAIAGAGQAGLQLALGLLSKGYKITLVTDRDADSFLHGPIMSNQAMFNEALQYERELGIDHWEQIAPQNTSVTFPIAIPKTTEIGIRWQGLVEKPFQSIDQRIKFSHWIHLFEKQGGNLQIEKASDETLAIIKEHEAQEKAVMFT